MLHFKIGIKNFPWLFEFLQKPMLRTDLWRGKSTIMKQLLLGLAGGKVQRQALSNVSGASSFDSCIGLA
jgi:hypothetical protein